MGNDFIVETEGHCFLCLEQISSSPPHLFPGNNTKSETASETCPVSVHSLQYLSRYIKMNMEKVFREKEAHLMEQVNQSTLKAPLCEGCSNLTEKLSERIRQLDKVEMEVGSYIKLVQQKLMEAKGTSSNADQFRKPSGQVYNSEEGHLAKLDIMRVLRTEAMEKCVQKLTNISLGAKIQQLKKVNDQLQTNRPAEVEETSVPHSSSSSSYQPDQFKTEGIKMDESMTEDSILTDDEQINFHLDDTTTLLSDSGEEEVPVEQPPGFPTGINPLDDDNDDDVDRASSGNYKCMQCSKEFKTKRTLRQHYKSAHLNLRIKCSLCSKEFTDKSNYRRHYNSAHEGRRFKCPFCDKVYSMKVSLTQHQNSAHFGKRHKCEFCPQTFSRNTNRTEHMKNCGPGTAAISTSHCSTG